MEHPRFSELLLKLLAPRQQVQLLVPRTLTLNHRHISLIPARNGVAIDCSSVVTTVSLPVLDLEEAGIEYDRGGPHVQSAIRQLLRDRRFAVTPNDLLIDIVDQFVAVAIALDPKSVTLEQLVSDRDCVTQTNPFQQTGFVITVDSPVKGLDISRAVVGPIGTTLEFYADIAHGSAAYNAIMTAREYVAQAKVVREAEDTRTEYLQNNKSNFFTKLMGDDYETQRQVETATAALRKIAAQFEKYLAAVA